MSRGDLRAILEIERASFPSPWPASAFDIAVAAPDLISVVIEDGGLAGYLVACPDGGELLIANVAVHPHRRRHGHGRRLLAEAVRAARTRRLAACRLEVRLANTEAQRLYHRVGFVPVGIRPGYYLQPAEDALTMRLELTPDAIQPATPQ